MFINVYSYKCLHVCFKHEKQVKGNISYVCPMIVM